MSVIEELHVHDPYACCHGGRKDIIELLLERGADVNAGSRVFGSPLMNAVRGGHTSAVRVLLAHGADVHATRTADNATPLSIANSQRESTIIRLLKAAGAK